MNKLVCLLVLGAVVSCVYSAPSLDRKNIRKVTYSHGQYTQTDTDCQISPRICTICTDRKKGSLSVYGPLIVCVSLVIQLITSCRPRVVSNFGDSGEILVSLKRPRGLERGDG